MGSEKHVTVDDVEDKFRSLVDSIDPSVHTDIIRPGRHDIWNAPAYRPVPNETSSYILLRTSKVSAIPFSSGVISCRQPVSRSPVRSASVKC